MPDQFYSVCMDMGSKDFPVNKNMCNFVKSAYGKSLFKYIYYGINVLMTKYFITITTALNNYIILLYLYWIIISETMVNCPHRFFL